MKKIVFIFMLTVLSFSLAFGQSWLWGKAGYCNGSFSAPDVQYAVAEDTNHNVYITGAYYGSIKFDSVLLTHNSIYAYLVKYDSAGKVLWAVQPTDSTSSAECYGLSVAVDKSGNIFVTGHFDDTIKFGSYKLIGGPFYDQSSFIAKYSPSGNVIWAKQSTPGNGCVSYSVSTDDFGDAYITGYFDGKVSFGNDTINNTSSTNYDHFLVKYDSAGNVIWAKQGNLHATGYSYGCSLASDKMGNVYIACLFSDTVSMDSATVLSPKTYSTFIAKYSPSGMAIWAKQSTNSSINSESWPFSVAIDNTSVYITGFFVDAVKFGSKSLYSPSTNSAYLVKYDTAGNFVWAEQSSVGWYGQSLACDNTNHMYLIGITDNNPDTLKFEGLQLTTSLSASYASFMIKFDSSGSPECGSMLNDGYATGVASDPTGNYIFTTGVFYDTLIYGVDTLLGGYGDNSVFTGRWQPCIDTNATTSITPISNNPSLSLFPNPNTGVFTISISNYVPQQIAGTNIEIYNVLGEKVYSATPYLPADIAGRIFSYPINISSQPNGIYLYRVLNEDGSLTGKGKLIISK